MRTKKTKIKNQIITSLFLIIIGGLIFNSAFYLHSHLTSKGAITQHAHPFKKNAEKQKSLPKHNHKSSDFYVINIGSLLFNSINEVSILSSSKVIAEFTLVISADYADCYFTTINLRGPPSGSSFLFI